jgi:LPS-assembly protein
LGCSIRNLIFHRWFFAFAVIAGFLIPQHSTAAAPREWKNVYPVYQEPSALPVPAPPVIPTPGAFAPAAKVLLPGLEPQMPMVETAQPGEQPVDLSAKSLQMDQEGQIITAMGDVELIQAGRTLKAEKVSYNLKTDQVRATGEVVLKETDGTIYYADDVELTQDMKDGFVEGLQILLADGSRFSAEKGTRQGGTVLTLKQATYTPCEPCKEDPTRPPLWQLRAAEVTHDDESKSIAYKNAWFELAGVPLAYTPYFSHPDGTEKQKSGFVSPRVGFDSDRGASYQQEYYWAIAPYRDMTIGTILSTDVNPVALAEYRQRFDNAEIEFNGSTTYSDRPDRSGNITRDVGDELRGHLFGEGLWDINEQWRSGYKIALATDEQYLRQYDISSEDILENELFVERFEDRNYFVGRFMGFQDYRISDRQVDQPFVLPEVIASFYGDPNAAFGGRWSVNLSALGLEREGSGQDVARTSAEMNWQRRFVTNFGLVNTFDALLRGDAYNVKDRDQTSLGNREHDDFSTRGFAMGNWNVAYPFVNRFERSQWILEPQASVTTATNVDYDGDIPNEDSRDFTLDPTNLFEPNRSPGYDLIEDRSHVTYGFRTGYHTDEGSRAEVFFGQSRRFEDDDNPFVDGSGLSEQNSDYVGQVSANIGNAIDIDYRFQLENSNFSAKRHEVDAVYALGPFDFYTRYFYANALETTDLNQSREQIRQSINYNFYGDWSLRGTAWYDLGEEEGLRQATYGLVYSGQCLTFSAMAERTLTEEATGDSSTEIMFRLGLKNLGEFETSGIDIGGGSDTEDEEENNFEK